jgi:hypothetical protein
MLGVQSGLQAKRKHTMGQRLKTQNATLRTLPSPGITPGSDGLMGSPSTKSGNKSSGWLAGFSLNFNGTPLAAYTWLIRSQAERLNLQARGWE